MEDGSLRIPGQPAINRTGHFRPVHLTLTSVTQLCHQFLTDAIRDGSYKYRVLCKSNHWMLRSWEIINNNILPIVRGVCVPV